MAEMRLAKHGSAAGYRKELETGTVCERCRNANRVYQKQYTKAGRAAGLKYSKYDVIDHLYVPGKAGPGRAGVRPGQARPYDGPTERPAGPGDDRPAGPDQPGPDPSEAGSGPSIGDRIGDALRGFVGSRSANDYVDSDEPPDYITPGIADPEPEGDWSQVKDEGEYVITREGLALIEDNLGTYLSVIGITLEMIDPYCGPILADNFGNIVGRWTKVIARYPKAAKLFMSKDGGTLFLWIGALQATWPVLLAVYEHHLSKSIQTDKQGRVFRVERSANGHGPTVDATMPGQNFNYTVD